MAFCAIPVIWVGAANVGKVRRSQLIEATQALKRSKREMFLIKLHQGFPPNFCLLVQHFLYLISPPKANCVNFFFASIFDGNTAYFS